MRDREIAPFVDIDTGSNRTAPSVKRTLAQPEEDSSSLSGVSNSSSSNNNNGARDHNHHVEEVDDFSSLELSVDDGPSPNDRDQAPHEDPPEQQHPHKGSGASPGLVGTLPSDKRTPWELLHDRLRRASLVPSVPSPLGTEGDIHEQGGSHRASARGTAPPEAPECPSAVSLSELFGASSSGLESLSSIGSADVIASSSASSTSTRVYKDLVTHLSDAPPSVPSSVASSTPTEAYRDAVMTPPDSVDDVNVAPPPSEPLAITPVIEPAASDPSMAAQLLQTPDEDSASSSSLAVSSIDGISTEDEPPEPQEFTSSLPTAGASTERADTGSSAESSPSSSSSLSSFSFLTSSVEVPSSAEEDDDSSLASSVDRVDVFGIENIPLRVSSLGDHSNALGSTENTTKAAEPKPIPARQYVLAKGSSSSLHLDPRPRRVKSNVMPATSRAFASGKGFVPPKTLHPAQVTIQESYLPVCDLVPLIVRFVPHGTSIVVDLGCGRSILCRELVFKGYNHVVGVDSNREIIRLQKASTSELAAFVLFREMDATSLAFPDNFCDCIVTKATMDELAVHRRRLMDALCEIVRCLQPGGVWLNVSWFESPSSLWVDDEDDGQPWWELDAVKEFLSRNFEHEETFRAGQPRLIDGEIIKPYVVSVWRKKESYLQRFRRVLISSRRLHMERRMFQAVCRLHRAKLDHAKEEEQLIRELRQMIVEDSIGRQQRAFENEETDCKIRQTRRDEFYAALVANEIADMVNEDDLAHRMRENEFVVLKTIREILMAMIEAALPRVLSVQPPNVGDVSLQSVDETKHRSTPEHTTVEWIRSIVIELADKVVGPQSMKALSRRRKPQISPQTESLVSATNSTRPILDSRNYEEDTLNTTSTHLELNKDVQTTETVDAAVTHLPRADFPGNEKDTSQQTDNCSWSRHFRTH